MLLNEQKAELHFRANIIKGLILIDGVDLRLIALSLVLSFYVISNCCYLRLFDGIFLEFLECFQDKGICFLPFSSICYQNVKMLDVYWLIFCRAYRCSQFSLLEV